ncbi:MAG: DNA-directed DNA polymerase I [Promethearchaeota archaeon]
MSKKKKSSSPKGLDSFLPIETDLTKKRSRSSNSKTKSLPSKEKTSPEQLEEENINLVQEMLPDDDSDYETRINEHIEDSEDEDFEDEDDLEFAENIIEAEELENQVINKSGKKSKSKIVYSIPDPQKEYFLMSVVYDPPPENCAALRCYEPESKKFFFFRDPLKHRPYCISGLKRDQIDKQLSYTKVKVDIEEIKLIDPFSSNEEIYHKVITETPSDVPKIRDLIPPCYEAKILYFRNWIYDAMTPPGLPYRFPGENRIELAVDTSAAKEGIPSKVYNELYKYQNLLENNAAAFSTPIPSLKMVAFDIETKNVTNQVPKPFDPQEEIICVCFVDSDNQKIALVLERDDVELGEKPQDFPTIPQDLQIIWCKSEEILILRCFEILMNYPVIVGYNSDNFDLAYLDGRAKKIGISQQDIPFYQPRQRRMGGGTFYDYPTGLHLDLYLWFSNPAIKIYVYGGKYAENSLDAVSEALLNAKKVQLEQKIGHLPIYNLIHYCLKDTELTFSLMADKNYLAWNLMVLLARVTKTSVDDLVRTRVTSWLQSLINYEHRRREMLIPNQEDIDGRIGHARSEAMSKDKGYKGAIVVDPEEGIHFNVVVLDFASLYPTIIMTRNLSYETINCGHPECKTNIIVDDLPYYVCTKKDVGILAEIVGFLRDVRVKWFKNAAKKDSDPNQRQFYDVLQSCFKVLINAFYGALGAKTFPYYCVAAAESTTAVGRWSILETIEKCKELGVNVLYGDTDSVFLHNSTQEQVDELINWSTKHLRIDLAVDKVYRYCVLSSRKKNYLGVFDSSSGSKKGFVDVKGLSGKKSNTPLFIQSAFQEMTDILAEVTTEEEFKLAKQRIQRLVKNCYKKLDQDRYSAEELAFSQQMTKEIDDYKKTTPQHVRAAKQLKDKLKMDVRAGTVIRFLKMKNGEVLPLELANTKEIDIKTYKEQVFSIFSQVTDVLKLDINPFPKQLNLKDFFSK